jgi:16S rRNA (guanine966-N2)-methyltransferase
MSLRITGGLLKGKILKTARRHTVRPTSDRARSSLFEILRDRISLGWFVDLFAGTGIVGIEALSRGARGALFIERDPEICRELKENLANLGLITTASVINSNAQKVLKFIPHGETISIIFVDPPYQSALLDEILEILGHFDRKDDFQVIVEHHHKTALNANYGILSFHRSVFYGETVMSFFSRAESKTRKDG